MKYIEKKSIVSLPQASGSISDTWNIENKKENAPSIDLIQKSLSYSTEEVFTGTYWIDGKPIYKKVIECGAMPNATNKQVPTGLSNAFYLDYEILMHSTANRAYIKLPSISLTSLNASIVASITWDNINLITKSDYSMYDEVFAFLFYTKPQ